MVGELSGIASAAAWALASLALKDLSARMNAAVINGVRCGISLFFFLGVLLFMGRGAELFTMPLFGLTMLVLSGFVGVGVGDVLYIWSMRIIGAARTMPITGAYPLLTLIPAIFFLGERVTPAVIGGTVLVLSGATLLAVPPQVGFGSMRTLIHGKERVGLGLAVATALTWAFSAMVLKLGLQEIDTVLSTIVRLATASASLLLIAGVVERGSVDVRKIDARAWGWIGLITVAGTISTFLFVVSVQMAGAAKASALTATAPLFALPIAVRMGERVTGRVVLGTFLTVGGIWLLVF
ncbi:MAG: DMT family transporter [Chloroflexota bacterium]